MNPAPPRDKNIHEPFLMRFSPSDKGGETGGKQADQLLNVGSGVKNVSMPFSCELYFTCGPRYINDFFR